MPNLLIIAIGIAVADVGAGFKNLAEIRVAATSASAGPGGRPLPLLSGWNKGGSAGQGYTPAVQRRLLVAGRRLLPWLPQPTPDGKEVLPYGGAAFLRELAEARAPVSFVSTQWESVLWNAPGAKSSADGPFLLRAPDRIEPKLSPLGDASPWAAPAAAWFGDTAFSPATRIMPRPTRVIFASNNEQPKLRWYELEQDIRFARRFPQGFGEEARRRFTGDAWIERYGVMLASIKQSLPPEWRSTSSLVGYNAFGPPHLGRFGGWKRHSLTLDDRIEPWSLVWDGASVPHYLNHWEAITDYAVYSPQVQAMNWVIPLDEALARNHHFWFELSVWDGFRPGKTDGKRAALASAGKPFGPERYVGMTLFGMWMLRPRVVREFRSHTDPLADCLPYTEALADAVDQIHRDPVLADFWRRGRLVANDTIPHPYQKELPKCLMGRPRWFALSSDLDPPRPWNLTTPIPLFSLALERGEAPEREWLVVACSPLNERLAATVVVPGFGEARIAAAPAGTYFIIRERDRSAARLPPLGEAAKPSSQPRENKLNRGRA